MIDIRSFRDFLRLFFIYKNAFKITVIVTFIVIVLGAFLLPSQYESNARLLVKPGRENSTLPIEVSNRQTFFSPSTQRDPVVDEEKLLTGQLIVNKVANYYLAISDDRQPQSGWESFKNSLKNNAQNAKEALRNVFVFLHILEDKPLADRLAERLEKNFRVAHEPGSAVMEVSFTWGNPEVAQIILNQWITFYLEERTRSLSRNSLQSFYEGEMVLADKNISEIKSELQKHYKDINSVGAKERLENITDQMNRLADLKIEKSNEIAGLQAVIKNSEEEIKKQPLETLSEREISLNPTQLDLKLKLNALKDEHSRALRVFLPQAPQVQQIEQSIADVKILIDKESTRVERSQNRVQNPILSNLKNSIVTDRLRLSRLSSEILDIDKKTNNLIESRSKVLTSEPGINRLLMQLGTAEKSYELYSDNLEKARIDKALDDNLISNIAVIEPAKSKLGRIFPKTLLMLLISIPISIITGFLMIYISYLIDQRIHDGDSIEEKFNVPLWGVLPDLDNSNEITANFNASLYRIFSLVYEKIKNEGLTIAFVSTHRGAGSSFIIKHLQRLIEDEGFFVVSSSVNPVEAGQVVLLDAGALLENKSALLTIRQAEYVVLVAEACRTTVPMLNNSISILNTAFGKVDGIVLNRRRFEVPHKVLNQLARLQGSE